MIELIHTSPANITEIHSTGLFGSFLFFSEHEYVMSAGDHITYAIEVNECDVIDAARIFYDDQADKLASFVTEVCELVGCDEDTAENLISQQTDVHSIECDVEPEDLADVSWEIQHITARAACALGYAGVAVQDEQGVAYMINMSDRLNDLVKK